jgi:hypothetical protein
MGADDGVDPYQITSDYRTLLVSDWTRLGFAEVDYGWGPPAHVVPLTNLDYIATCNPGEAVGPQARGAAHHAVRHPGPRRRLPRGHARHELNKSDGLMEESEPVREAEGEKEARG